MEVILKQDILKLGHKDEIVKVKPGYGMNYLIPQGLATMATDQARKVLAENLKQRAHKEEKIKKDAEELAGKLKELSLTVGAKASSTGKIFGSVNTIQISEAIEKAGFKIDRKKIHLKQTAIKELGKYSAKVILYKGIEIDIPFEVVAE